MGQKQKQPLDATPILGEEGSTSLVGAAAVPPTQMDVNPSTPTPGHQPKASVGFATANTVVEASITLDMPSAICKQLAPVFSSSSKRSKSIFFQGSSSSG